MVVLESSRGDCVESFAPRFANQVLNIGALIVCCNDIMSFAAEGCVRTGGRTE